MRKWHVWIPMYYQNKNERKNCTRGFTLIEILIALAIFSLVGSVIVSVFNKGVFAWKKDYKEDSLHQKARLSLELIAAELRNMCSFKPIEFEGESSSIAFASHGSGKKEDALCRIEYYFDTLEKSLKRNYRNVNHLYSHKQGIDEKLISGVDDFHIQYAYLDYNTDIIWEDTWEEKDVLPAGVRINISLSDEEGESIRFSKTVHIPIGVVRKK